MSDATETSYLESCCFNDIQDQHPRNLPRGACKCRCHVDRPERVGISGGDRQTLLWVADDLRGAAEAHLKSAAICGKRIERKHLTHVADVLLERAKYYEGRAGRGVEDGPTP